MLDSNTVPDIESFYRLMLRCIVQIKRHEDVNLDTEILAFALTFS